MFKNYYKKYFNLFHQPIFLRELLYFLSLLLVVLIGLEIAWPNIVLAYFNLNYLLLVYLIIALILLIVPDYLNKSTK